MVISDEIINSFSNILIHSKVNEEINHNDDLQINQRKLFSIEVHTNRCRSEQSIEHDTKFSTVTLTMLMYVRARRQFNAEGMK